MTFLDLPHASVLWDPQNPVSVIIRCKVTNSRTVENTALSQMRSRMTGAACCVILWGYLATTSRDIMGVHICRHFVF